MFYNVPMAAITTDKARFLISDSISSESTDFSTGYLGRRGGVEVNTETKRSVGLKIILSIFVVLTSAG